MRYSIKQFLHHEALRGEASSGIVLMVMAALAMVLANLSGTEFYAAYVQSSSLVFFVNDILMVAFFFLVGLEIKREMLVGNLSSKEAILQPCFAAVGGMVVPALIFVLCVGGNKEVLHGWAIPCATDIAFALGVLALLGKRVPLWVKTLLLAVAILDDLGAIVIIALFYTEQLSLFYAALAAMAGFLLWRLNRFHVTAVWAYMLAGGVVWFGLLKAGVHPTLAGVVTAFSIPLRGAHAPLEKLEKDLHPWIAFGVLPIFAFVNAGLSLRGMNAEHLAQPITMGVIIGLLVGKPLGIMGGLWLAHITAIARKPRTRKWGDYVGMACLCGIGFTMSLFINGLAYEDVQWQEQAKLGVLSASLLSAGIGLLVSRHRFARHLT